MAKLELFYRNALDASCDGGTWNLFLERAVLDGRELTDADELDDFLTLAGAEEQYQYYNDNPSELGFPESKLKVGSVELDCEELCGTAGWENEGETVRVELDV